MKTKPVVDVDEPQLQAGRLVAAYLQHRLTFQEVNAKLAPLGFAFCMTCYAHRPNRAVGRPTPPIDDTGVPF